MTFRSGSGPRSDSAEHPLTRLAAELGPYDTLDLVRTLAALQLMPENADRLARLEAGAVVAASIQPGVDRRQMGVRRLNWLVNESTLASGLAPAEDPYNAPFTEGVDFIGGNYLILPGQAPHAGFVLSSLAQALATEKDTFPDQELRKLCMWILGAALRVSDVMARRAGLGRGDRPQHRPPGSVLVPKAERLGALKEAVNFTRAQLVEMLGPHALVLLAQLISLPNAELLKPEQVFDGPLHLHPLLLHGDDLIVALPTAVAPNAVQAVIRLLLQDGHRNRLVRRYRHVVTARAVRSMRRLDIDDLTLPADLRSADEIQACAFSIDSDKVMTLILAVDDLKDYDPTAVVGRWGSAVAVVDAMEQRQLRLEEYLMATRAPNEIIHVYSLNGLFRATFAGLGSPLPPLRASRGFFQAAELDVVCAVEHSDPLAIYKYLHAHDRLRQRTKVVGYGSLDEFSIWRKAEHSYYLADDGRPDMMSVAPAGSDELMLEVVDRTDPHAVPTIDGTMLIPVIAAEGDRRVPIYGSLDPRHPFGFWVEIEAPCWVIVSFQAEDPDYRNAAALLGQAVAYWVWRLAPDIVPLFSTISKGRPPLQIEIRPLPGPGWTEGRANPAEPRARGVEGGIRVDVPDGFVATLAGPDNRGERALMAVILRELRAAAGIDEDAAARNAAVGRVIEQRMPLGAMKKFITLDPSQHWNLRADEHAAPLRFVQEADSALVLDELGPALAARLGLRLGQVPDENRLEVLAHAVAWCFEQLEATFAQLMPAGLIERLVSHHERLLLEDAMERLTSVTRLACYADMPELMGRIRDRRTDFVHSAIAYRTVIEMAVARPAHGLRPFSLERLDRMIALADEAVRRAMTRDSIQNGVSDVKVSILGSGRLGMSRGGRFETGHKRFLDVYTEAELRRATEGFGKHWRAIDAIQGDEPPAEVARVAAATREEFGLTLLDLLHFLRGVLEIGLDQQASARVMERDALRARLGEELGWDRDAVERALNLFTLGPRADFLRAPDGLQPFEVWPWRFNRQLSYIRRPLLLRHGEAGVEEIVWGNRHVQEVAKYLIELCLGGRLQARSAVMRRVIGEIHAEEAAAFNEKVAAVQRAVPGAVVRKNVKRVGGVRIARKPGQDLGDIDVLAAIPSARTVRAIESKDLSIARTPVELGHQATATFRGSADHPSDVDRHVERARWLQAHMPELLAWLGISDQPARWRVEAFVVVDEELIAPFVLDVPLAVVPFATYAANGGAPGLSRDETGRARART